LFLLFLVATAGSLSFLPAALSTVPSSTTCLASSTTALNVVGQSSFITAFSGTGLKQLSYPYSAKVDPVTKKLFVADFGNNRLLRFSATASTLNGDTAEVQLFSFGSAATASNVNNLYDIDFTPAGACFIADTGHHRVPRWDNCGTIAANTSASQVLGQASFTTSTSGQATNQMNEPFAVTYDSLASVLWVSEYFNYRVTRFNSVLSKAATNAAADGILGITGSFGAAQNKFFYPYQVAVDILGTLFVTDPRNNRVMAFKNASTKATSANADFVIGQSTFTSTTSAASQTGMNQPYGIAVDEQRDILYISEYGNSRVTVYYNKTKLATNNPPANLVIGQASFVTSAAPSPPTASSLKSAAYAFFDSYSTSSLLITDFGNNRILRYCSEVPSSSPSRSITVSKSFSHSFSTTASHLPTPTNLPTPSVSRSFGVSYSSSISISKSPKSLTNSRSISNSHSASITRPSVTASRTLSNSKTATKP